MKPRLAILSIRLSLTLLMLLVAAPAQQSPGARTPYPPRRPAPSRTSPQPDSAPSFKVNVKLVNLFASVVDNDGAPYVKLGRDDFRIFEDGVEQKLAVFERQSALPLSIVLEMDTSMSTRKDIGLELAAGRKFAENILRPIDAMAVYAISTYVFQVLPFTHDERRVYEALDHLRPGTATALYDAITLGAQALERRQGRKVIVLVTDGGDTASKTDYAGALRTAQTAEAILYPIVMVPIEADAGRDIGGEHALIQLAQDTGGKYYYASSLNQLDDAFRQIDEELRTQYLLAYYPKTSAAGFHRITIELTQEAKERAGRELSLHHRAGYYTGNP